MDELFLTYNFNKKPTYIDKENIPNFERLSVISDITLPDFYNQDKKEIVINDINEQSENTSSTIPSSPAPIKQSVNLTNYKPEGKTIIGGDKEKFIKQFTPYAEKISKATGIDKNFLIAKAGLETGWGKSMYGYNFGNVTAGKNWKGEVINRGDKNAKGEAITQKFRKYKSLDDSSNDYINFIQSSRYKGLRGLSAEDAANYIGTTGYAEDPNYSKKILNILQNLNM